MTEKRVDPVNGMPYTYDEMSANYMGQYTQKAIKAYWKECTPVKSNKARSKAKLKAKKESNVKAADLAESMGAEDDWFPLGCKLPERRPSMPDVYPQTFEYTARYNDGEYFYRHVTLPKNVAQKVYDLMKFERLLTEHEWRSFGILGSPGWAHYAIHQRKTIPLTRILFFRRPLYPDELDHSDKPTDENYEYREWYITKAIAQAYFNLTQNKRLLEEDEWRALGVCQSRGWVHYRTTQAEPYALYFRRPVGTDPAIGLSGLQRKVLTVHANKDDDFHLDISCFSVGGEKLVCMKKLPYDSCASLQYDIAKHLDIPPELICLVFPNGVSVDDPNSSMQLDKLVDDGEFSAGGQTLVSLTNVACTTDVLTSIAWWRSDKGRCHIARDKLTGRLSYEEIIRDGSQRVFGFLDHRGQEEGNHCWEASLVILQGNQPPWYGPSYGERPQEIGKIRLRFAIGQNPPASLRLYTHMKANVDTDWAPAVVFNPVSDDSEGTGEVLTSIAIWHSEKGQCHIAQDKVTGRLSYEEFIGDGSQRIFGFLDHQGREEGSHCWESSLVILGDHQPLWHGGSGGEQPEEVGKIRLRLVIGQDPPASLRLHVRIKVDVDTDWAPAVVFNPISDDNDAGGNCSQTI